MRLSLDWLAEFIDLPDAATVVDRLTYCGFEDVEVVQTGPDLSGVRVGHVLSRDPHPNADRLSVCRVDVGDDETVEVVCGAPNVAAEQKIAFAPVGVTLPDGTRLKRAKIRGVVSTGMICSNRELGLGEDHDGILVLDPAARVGAPVTDAITSGASELEYTITPNRGDAACLIGIAREIRALFGGELRIPPTEPPEEGAPASESVSIDIEVPDECYRYVGRVVRGVSIGPSPEWVVERLAASGIRAINNVVDVTNLVLLEFGQPLHAFDLSSLHDHRIRVRRAESGETLLTLDGEKRTLDSADVVIADADRAIALAGVMGGVETEVGERTSDVLIESAHFHPVSVRLSARRHGLRTEASYRFERGVDRAEIERAADRAASLMAELAGGRVAPGAVIAVGQPPPATEAIDFSAARANRLLGTDLTPNEMRSLLARVDVTSEAGGGEAFRCAIPTHRNDLHLQEDLTEEVARIYGYEQIPITEPVGILRGVEHPESWTASEKARDALVGAGLVECQTLPFAAEAWLDALGLAADDPLRGAVRLTNPINEAEPFLRTTLVPSLLRLVHQNRSRQAERVDVFELGRTFLAVPEGPGGAGEGTWGAGLPIETLKLAAIVAAPDQRRLWDSGSPPPLFFRAKGIAKKLLIQLGYVASFPGGETPPYLHPGAAARIDVEGTQTHVGSVGEVHPDVIRSFDLDVACALLELDLTALAELRREVPQFEGISRQPAARRDLAVVLGADQPAESVLAAIRQKGGRDLVSVDLFDRYEGQGVPEGRVSLAFRLVFQRSDRTLTDDEVSKATERVVRMLSHRFEGELR